jgi:hypothetical protein
VVRGGLTENTLVNTCKGVVIYNTGVKVVGAQVALRQLPVGSVRQCVRSDVVLWHLSCADWFRWGRGVGSLAVALRNTYGASRRGMGPRVAAVPYP